MYKNLIYSGVLKLNNVTPIIEALFSPYYLTAKVPDQNHVNFAYQYEATGKEWDQICVSLQGWVKSHIKNKPIFADTPTAKELLHVIGVHFKVTNSEFFRIIETINFQESPEFYQLYDLATHLDDGHGLVSIFVGNAWQKDGKDIYMCGGSGTYLSQDFRYCVSSDQHQYFCNRFGEELANRCSASASTILLSELNTYFRGIQDKKLRAEVRYFIARELLEDIFRNIETRSLLCSD